MVSFEGEPTRSVVGVPKKSDQAPVPMFEPENKAMNETRIGANDSEYGVRPPMVSSIQEPDTPAPVPVHAVGNPFRSGENVVVLPDTLVLREPANKPTLDPSFSETVTGGLGNVLRKLKNLFGR